jgi:hypothetical protein
MLDEPFPSELHVVGACYDCNNSASADETYLACAVECALWGATDASGVQRKAVAKALLHSPKLSAAMANMRGNGTHGPIYSPDVSRVERVLLKMARAHGLYELHERMEEEPFSTRVAPLLSLSAAERAEFERFAGGAVYPEVGSRALQRLFKEPDRNYPGWVVVQPGRYRYMAAVGQGRLIRIVMSEYLAYEAIWATRERGQSNKSTGPTGGVRVRSAHAMMSLAGGFRREILRISQRILMSP